MTIDKVMDYILHTPLNTNKAILRQMLEELINSQEPEPDEVVYDGGLEK